MIKSMYLWIINILSKSYVDDYLVNLNIINPNILKLYQLKLSLDN